MKFYCSLFIAFFAVQVSYSQGFFSTREYAGITNMGKLTIINDSTGTLSYKLHTTVAFVFQCKIAVYNDSVIVLKNMNKEDDFMFVEENVDKKVKKGKYKIRFVGLRYEQNPFTRLKEEYEINELRGCLRVQLKNDLLCIDSLPAIVKSKDKIEGFSFMYSWHNYIYNVKNESANSFLFKINTYNSFFIERWVLRNGTLYPVSTDENLDERRLIPLRILK